MYQIKCTFYEIKLNYNKLFILLIYNIKTLIIFLLKRMKIKQKKDIIS